MEISDYLRALRRGWLLMLVLLVAGVAVGAAASAALTPKYSAQAKAYVTVDTTSNIVDLTTGTQLVQQAIASYADIATSAVVLDPVRANLKLDETTAQLAGSISVTTATGESVLDVAVTDTSPARAAAIANAVVTQLSSAVDSLTLHSAGTRAPIAVRMIDPAVADPSPVFPKPALLVLLGALTGLLVGFLVAVLREVLDTRLRGAEDVARASDAPVIGAISEDRRRSATPPGSLIGDRRGTAWSEQYRTLRNNLRFIRLDGEDRGFVVTSSVAGEGKTTTVVHLGLALADLGERVLLVDADLRRPQLGARFGLESGLGLTDLLIGTARLDEAIQSWGDRGLKILPSGSLPPNPNELLQSSSMQQFIAMAVDRFDVVIFDTPPLTSVSDAAVLARATSGAVVLAAVGVVRRAQLLHAESAIEHAGGRVLGVVLNRVRGRSPAYYSSPEQPAPEAQPRPVGELHGARP